MLSLASPTRPDWAAGAVAELDVLLVDHAHCEKKAASTAINLLFRYPEHSALLRPLSALAREELAHFELVLDVLERRGVPYRRSAPSPYAGRLHGIVRPEEPDRLLDSLLCCAVIEARSCERMKLLADALTDPELADFYRGLLAAEARHHGTYVDLAREVFPERKVLARLAEITLHEAQLLRLSKGGPRLHD